MDTATITTDDCISQSQARLEQDALRRACATKRPGEFAMAAKPGRLETAVLVKDRDGWRRIAACREGRHWKRAEALAQRFNHYSAP